MNNVTDTHYTKLNDAGFVEIQGKHRPITVDEHEIDCVLYRPGKNHFAKWNVIEQHTGLAVGYGETKIEAITHAEERLTTEITRLGYDEFRKKYFIGQDASPRYGGGAITE